MLTSALQELFKKRWSLRVTVCGKRTKRSEQLKSAAVASSDELIKSSGKDGIPVSGRDRRDYLADKDKQQGDSSRKKRKLDNGDFAAKRIKLKVCTLCCCC